MGVLWFETSPLDQQRNKQPSLIKQGVEHTLADSTLIISFSKMLKFSKMISSTSKNIVKDNSKYLKIFHWLK
jgi:hypothetical protein